MFAKLLIFFALLAVSIVVAQDGVSISATRAVDLTSQIVKTKIEYEVKNQGKSDINHFLHLIPAKEDAQLAWISAFEKGKKETAKFRTAKQGVKDEVATHKIELLNLVPAGGSITVCLNISDFKTEQK